MSNYSTVNFQPKLPETDTASTEAWNKNNVNRLEQGWHIPKLGQVAGVVLALITSPVTNVPETWFIEKKRRDTAITVRIIQEISGRRISRAEALRIVRQILERANRERIELAQWEARQGIQWEDET